MNEDTPGPKFLSIERVVAFLLGPAVVALSSRFSLWLAETSGVHLSSADIVAALSTGGLTAGALVYKWLHGRQIEATSWPKTAFGSVSSPIVAAKNDPAPAGQVAVEGAAPVQ